LELIANLLNHVDSIILKDKFINAIMDINKHYYLM